MLTAGTLPRRAAAVNPDATVQLGANDHINDAATVTLNGGKISTGGFQAGRSTGAAAATTNLGTLTLSGSSTLDFGSGHTGSGVFAFANSSGQAWTGTLTLTDFTPGTDYLSFVSNGGLTTTQPAEITLTGFNVSGLDTFGHVLFRPYPNLAPGQQVFCCSVLRVRQDYDFALSSDGRPVVTLRDTRVGKVSVPEPWAGWLRTGLETALDHFLSAHNLRNSLALAKFINGSVELVATAPTPPPTHARFPHRLRQSLTPDAPSTFIPSTSPTPAVPAVAEASRKRRTKHRNFPS